MNSNDLNSNTMADTSSWEPHNLMYNSTLWVHSLGVVIQGFTAAVMTWVESPWDSSQLFLVPRIQQMSFGWVNKHVEFIGQFKEVPWRWAHSLIVSFVLRFCRCHCVGVLMVALEYPVCLLEVAAYVDGMDGIVPALDKTSE
jgi:hypothetical protein